MSEGLPLSRREFLTRAGQGLGLVAFSQVAPAFVTQSLRANVPRAERDRSILVILQLAGGNDGLNTLVPWEDDRYYRLRPNLALPPRELLRVGDGLGLHPSCAGLHRLLNDGRLAVIQNVGYPNPNRSHFRSTEIWESAEDAAGGARSGWIGRYLDNCCAGSPGDDADPVSIFDDAGFPVTLQGTRDHNVLSLPTDRRQQRENDRLSDLLGRSGGMEGDEHDPTHYLRHSLMNAIVHEQRVLERMRAYRTPVTYPDSRLGRSLRSVAGLIAGGLETRVYYVSLSGFDTHANQLARHAALLEELSTSLLAFDRDLRHHRLDDQVLTMTFSEFGRRPMENVAGGTDHGTAAPLFVMGGSVNGGLHGSAPDLDVSTNGDLRFETDFRGVYATILRDWFQSDPAGVIGREFKPLDFLA